MKLICLLSFFLYLGQHIHCQERVVKCDSSYFDVVLGEVWSGADVIRGDLTLTGTIRIEDFTKEYCTESWSNFSVTKFGDAKFLQVIYNPGSRDPKLATYYYTNTGNIAMVVPFRRGKVHGLVYTYHPNGDCLTIMSYRRGFFKGYRFYWGQMDRKELKSLNSTVEGDPLSATVVVR